MTTYNEILNRANLNPSKDLDLIYEDLNMIYTNKYIDIINFVMLETYNYTYEKKENKTVRTEQSKFREQLIARDKVCLISGDDRDICEGCHIVPYAECKTYNLNNGILLNNIFHTMFDSYNISFRHKKNNEFTIIMKQHILDNISYKNYHLYHKKCILIDISCINNLKIHYKIFLTN